MAKYIVAITDASGCIYGFRIAAELLKADHEVYLITTGTGKKFMERELSASFGDLIGRLDNIETGMLHIEDPDNPFSVIATGSFDISGMIIAPCAMGTLGQIASGAGSNLIIRAADICLKERRKLVLITRETPLNAIHLENMLRLTHAGAVIMPPSPSFYSHPEALGDIINEIVGKALTAVGVENDLYKRWDNRLRK